MYLLQNTELASSPQLAGFAPAVLHDRAACLPLLTRDKTRYRALRYWQWAGVGVDGDTLRLGSFGTVSG